MSNDLFAGIGVVPGTFLLPRPDANWTAWACVACDQYTSEPEYWQRVNTLVGHQPSTLRLILPECDLPAPPERIDAIHAAMRDALNVLHPGVTDGFVLLERTTSTGKRLGLVCCVDLERYRYDGAKTLIRPTEETVASRLPARLAVRNGAPLESTTYKFAKCLQKRFGVIEGITDKGYITNSYHVHVTEPIDAFKKLEFEAQFQHLSPGGAISYVEVPDMQNNLDAVLEVMKFIYDHIIYAELNTKSDYCQVCGWDGEIEVVEEDGKLIWKCPQCGNTDQDKMNVARRTCGYIGTQFWNQGRTQEIKDRVLHL